MNNFVIIKIMKKTKVTTEDLAVMVQRGFEGVDKKIEGLSKEVNKGFVEVKEWQRLADGKFDAIEMELIDIKKKLENVVDRHEFQLLKERVGKLEHRLAIVLGRKK